MRRSSAEAAGRISALPRAASLPQHPPSRPSPRRSAAVALPLLVLALALGACGSSTSSSGTAADPASAIPAAAPVYAGADVRPQGSEKTNALAAGRALTHQANPYLRLLAALQAPGAPPLDFTRDVSPWLGPHGGVFLSSLSSTGALLPLLAQGLLGTASSSSSGAFPFGAGRAQGAIVLDTSDLSKATAFVAAQAGHAGAHAASYRGVAYEATTGGIAFAVVHRFVVIGSESALHSVIDTTLGGAALLQAPGYAKLLAHAPSGALAHVYSNPTAGGEAAAKEAGLLGLLAGPRPANISLVATARSLEIDADTIASASSGTPGGLLSASAEGTKALSELPGDSWLALGLAHLGQSFGQDILGLRELATLGTSLGGTPPAGSGGGVLSVKSLLQGLLAPLGVLAANTAQARHDFTSWMGSGAVFAAGSGLLELKGAVVIESKNAALSRAAVAKLAAALQHAGDGVQTARVPGTEAAAVVKVSGLPLPLYIASGHDRAGQAKFVLGLGEASVGDALSPTSTLGSAPARATAASALGEGIEPSLIFEVPTLLSLLEAVGLTEDPTFSSLVPYLRSISSIAGGGHTLGGEVERFKLAVGLQGAG
jgi:hypothetical protein